MAFTGVLKHRNKKPPPPPPAAFAVAQRDAGTVLRTGSTAVEEPVTEYRGLTGVTPPPPSYANPPGARSRTCGALVGNEKLQAIARNEQSDHRFMGFYEVKTKQKHRGGAKSWRWSYVSKWGIFLHRCWFRNRILPGQSAASHLSKRRESSFQTGSNPHEYRVHTLIYKKWSSSCISFITSFNFCLHYFPS